MLFKFYLYYINMCGGSCVGGQITRYLNIYMKTKIENVIL